MVSLAVAVGIGFGTFMALFHFCGPKYSISCFGMCYQEMSKSVFCLSVVEKRCWQRLKVFNKKFS